MTRNNANHASVAVVAIVVACILLAAAAIASKFFPSSNGGGTTSITELFENDEGLPDKMDFSMKLYALQTFEPDEPFELVGLARDEIITDQSDATMFAQSLSWDGTMTVAVSKPVIYGSLAEMDTDGYWGYLDVNSPLSVIAVDVTFENVDATLKEDLTNTGCTGFTVEMFKMGCADNGNLCFDCVGHVLDAPYAVGSAGSDPHSLIWVEPGESLRVRYVYTVTLPKSMSTDMLGNAIYDYEDAVSEYLDLQLYVNTMGMGAKVPMVELGCPVPASEAGA